MMNRKVIFFMLLIIGSVLCVNDVIVKNLKLFVNETEYIIKGMAYNPAPISFLNGVSIYWNNIFICNLLFGIMLINPHLLNVFFLLNKLIILFRQVFARTPSSLTWITPTVLTASILISGTGASQLKGNFFLQVHGHDDCILFKRLCQDDKDQ